MHRTIPVVLGVLALLLASTTVSDAQNQKRYKGTRAIVVDQASGQLRLPTEQEVAQTVQTLQQLGQRPPEQLQQRPAAGGMTIVNLDGGFSGILLARPNADGTLETKCVFTFEEGAEFLGIVEDDAVR